MSNSLHQSFFQQDVLTVAPLLLGQHIIRKLPNGEEIRLKITQTEAYRGDGDLGCHASKGRTKRTEIMFHEGGLIYVYLVYGMHWMLNIVTGEKENPQAVLIRETETYTGPGKLTKALQIDKSFYGENIVNSQRLTLASDQKKYNYTTAPRVGIDYAGEYWANQPWRFILNT